MADSLLWNVGVSLILVGFAIALIAVFWLAFSSVKGGKGKVKGGGAIIIGPVPIIFGTDRESVKIMLLLSIILVVLLLILTVLLPSVFG